MWSHPVIKRSIRYSAEKSICVIFFSHFVTLKKERNYSTFIIYFNQKKSFVDIWLASLNQSELLVLHIWRLLFLAIILLKITLAQSDGMMNYCTHMDSYFYSEILFGLWCKPFYCRLCVLFRWKDNFHLNLKDFLPADFFLGKLHIQFYPFYYQP